MPDDKKLDPFKPQPPQIPGVPAPKTASAAQHNSPPYPGTKRANKKSLAWMIAGVIGALVLGTGIYWMHRDTGTEKPAPTVAAMAPVRAVATAEPASPALPEILPVGPGKIATTNELAKAWSSKRFVFRNPSTDVETQAIVVHLPNGEYWAFSTREPYGTCELQYMAQPEEIARDYNFQTDHPLVADPCNRSLFDLLNYVQVPSGLVRGQIVAGAAVRPPVAIEVEKKGTDILAVRSE
ncbi:MAG: hypothetical protein ACRD4S_01490 [Candidatus Acidiferrales bacterium]